MSFTHDEGRERPPVSDGENQKGTGFWKEMYRLIASDMRSREDMPTREEWENEWADSHGRYPKTDKEFVAISAAGGVLDIVHPPIKHYVIDESTRPVKVRIYDHMQATILKHIRLFQAWDILTDYADWEFFDMRIFMCYPGILTTTTNVYGEREQPIGLSAALSGERHWSKCGDGWHSHDIQELDFGKMEAQVWDWQNEERIEARQEQRAWEQRMLTEELAEECRKELDEICDSIVVKLPPRKCKNCGKFIGVKTVRKRSWYDGNIIETSKYRTRSFCGRACMEKYRAVKPVGRFTVNSFMKEAANV